MKLVAISSLAPSSAFVLSEISRRWPLELVIQPGQSPQTAWTARWLKFLRAPWSTAKRRLDRTIVQGQQRRNSKRVAHLLFGGHMPALESPLRTIPVAEMNCDGTAEFLRAIAPDLLIVSGGPILKRKIFSIPRYGALNVHWGIAPQYRGEHTLFWPLYFRDYQHIGVTIHQIDDGIDTGLPLAQGFPELSPGDTEATLFAKCAPLAAKLLAEVIQSIAVGKDAPEPTLRQRGRLFRDRDRTAWVELTYMISRTFLRRNRPSSSPRATSTSGRTT